MVYYKIDASVPSGWRSSVRSGIGRRKDSTLCGPNGTEATLSSQTVRLTIYYLSSICGTSSFLAYACRHYANSYSDQAWSVTLKQQSPSIFGIGASGLYDVESVIASEMGHLSYAGPNPNWTGGPGERLPLGSTSCTVTNDTVSGFTAHTPLPARTVAAGDSSWSATATCWNMSRGQIAILVLATR